jgi:hypothetical protein
MMKKTVMKTACADVRADLRERLGDRATDAAAGAGHDRDLVVEPEAIEDHGVASSRAAA